jgi:hypothetical protein
MFVVGCVLLVNNIHVVWMYMCFKLIVCMCNVVFYTMQFGVYINK